MSIQDIIVQGKTVLGIEFGSTRIKAVLADDAGKVLAVGGHDWENRYEDGIWTYSLEDIWTGLQDCYADLAANVKKQYDVEITTIGAIGFSAMMHGYMPFDDKDELMVPFRTWRNNITGPASEALSRLFQHAIPQRWSIAHLYQAILNGEEHVPAIKFMTTLEGYIHWKMTGRKVLGIGEASGMFPIDTEKKTYNARMIQQFNELVADKKYPWKLEEVLPEILLAGDNAGVLTEEGAKLLDVSGKLCSGIPLCPPEGDAGTGMVATNSVAPRTGNVSAGTSVFAMIVLEKELRSMHPEIDLVTTPSGELVAMVHSNNCTTELNAWVNLFKEFAETMGMKVDMNDLYSKLYNKALEGDPDCGGLLAYGYHSGEHITGFSEGRPLLARSPESKFNLANLMRVQLYTSLGALKVGLDILRCEHVKIDKVLGHGGLFKTPVVGQRIMAAAMDTPVTVMETAGEGGAWGMAVLASYMKNKAENETLAEYLDKKIFAGVNGVEMAPIRKDVEGFYEFIGSYEKGLGIEAAAVSSMVW